MRAQVEGSREFVLCHVAPRRSPRDVSVELPVAAWLQAAAPGSFDSAVAFGSGAAQDDRGKEFWSDETVLLPYKAARPDNRRHVHVVVLIPFLAAGILRLAMAHLISPLRQRRLITPPHHGQALSIGRGVTLHVHKAWV